MSASSSPDHTESPLEEARPYRYRAFISYSHADRKWGRWLMRRLEGYRVPSRLVGKPGRYGPVPARLAPLFRDRDELPSSSDLSSGIREALTDSAALIVIASPAAARSRWVEEEVLTFKRLGRADRIYAIIVDGDPAAIEGEQACLPRALRFRLAGDGTLTGEEVEPAAADLRPQGDGRVRALRKLIAGLLGVGYDDLRRREVQRRNRRLVALTAASVLGMVVTIGLAISAYLAREDAERRRGQAESLLGFMVGDLRDSLEPLGRLNLLDKVGDEAMAYFQTVEPGDLTDEGLSRQAIVLTQIGEVRLSQARYDEALTSFMRAYERSAELAGRHRGDGQRLFDRGQAEYWVGYVAWERRDWDEARRWFQRYLGTSQALVGLDGSNAEWILELAYAHHNLAVLELDHGDASQAAVTFEQMLRTFEALDCDEPRCDPVKQDLADAVTWQGITAMTRGELADALGYFLEARGRYADLLAAAPNDRGLQEDYADETASAGLMALWLGRVEQADALLREAHASLAELVRHDPENLRWKEMAAARSLTLAQVALAEGSMAESEALIGAAREALEVVVTSEPSDPLKLVNLVRAERLRGHWLLVEGRPDEALAIVENALARLDAVARSDAFDAWILSERGAVHALLGDIRAVLGDRPAAREHCRSAIELTTAGLERSLDPRLAQPYVRAHRCLGEEANSLIDRIRATGLDTPGLWPE